MIAALLVRTKYIQIPSRQHGHDQEPLLNQTQTFDKVPHPHTISLCHQDMYSTQGPPLRGMLPSPSNLLNEVGPYLPTYRTIALDYSRKCTRRS